MKNLFWFVLLALLCVGCSKKLTPHEYLEKHGIQSQADMNSKHWNYLYPNIPGESLPEVIEKMATFERETSSDEWLTILFYSSHWLEKYPPVYDPKKEKEYWVTASKEFCQYLDNRIALLLEKKGDAAQVGMEGKDYFFVGQLTDEQKNLLRSCEPCFVVPKLGKFFDRYIYSSASWDFADNPIQAFMFEERDKELEPLRVAETPKLKELALTIGDIDSWDGSTSLQPVARIVAAHASGFPWKWRPSGSYHLSDANSVVYTDHYHWAFDDEIASGGKESYNRHLENSPKYDFDYSNNPKPIYPAGKRSRTNVPELVFSEFAKFAIVCGNGTPNRSQS